MLEGKDDAEIKALGGRNRRRRCSRVSRSSVHVGRKLSVNVNKVATVRNSRGGPSAVRDRSGAHVHRCRRAGHHRAPSRRRAAHHHRTTCTRSPRSWRRCEGRVEYNIEGDPRPGFPRARARGEARSVHAGAGEAGRDHERSRLAGGHAGRCVGGHHRRAEGRRRPRQPVRRSRARGDSRGQRRWARIASSCTPSRSRARSSAGRDAAAASFEKYSAAAQPRVRSRRRRQRRPRSRPEEPDAVSHAAAPRRSVDRPRADQPRDLRRPRQEW